MLHPFSRTERALRSVAYDLLSLRDGLSGWKPHRNAFLKSVRKDVSSLNSDVEAALQRILAHAYDSSPYYRRVFDEVGFRPLPGFRSDDLVALPFLTKDILREHKASLVSDRISGGQLHLSYTGGTTGTQTSFYLDHRCRVARVGRQWGILELCGYRPGVRRGLVWGVHSDLPVPGLPSSFKQWFRRYASGQETLCCTVMNEQLMVDYHARLLRFRPDIMYGYPSALTQLGRFIEERGLDPIRVGAVLTTAERLSAANRIRLTRMFGGEVFNLYCTREYGCVGFECKMHHGLHIDAESVFVEVVKDGQRVEPGQSGEIVITDLLNYGMPFIRSRTGDMGLLSPDPCQCGCPLPVLKALDGRASELIYRPDGSVVPGLMLTDLFADMAPIRFVQFVQERIDELDVRLVVTEGFSEQVRTEVVRQVRELMGQEIAVRVTLVDEIERNPRSGKLREFVCTVDSHHLAHQPEAPCAQE